MNVTVFLIEVVTCIFLTAACIFQLILFLEFVCKYKRGGHEPGKSPNNFSEHILSIFIFTNIWIIYFNGGFSLTGSFLSPFEQIGATMLQMFKFQEPILTLTVFYGMVLTLFGSVILYFPATLKNLIKSIIKKSYNDEVDELKTSVLMILIISFTSVIFLQSFYRFCN